MKVNKENGYCYIDTKNFELQLTQDNALVIVDIERDTIYIENPYELMEAIQTILREGVDTTNENH